MKKNWMAAALVVGLGAAGAVPAAAQQTEPVGLSVRAGLFFPSDSAARDESKQWFSGGVEYKLGDLQYAGPGSEYSAEYSVSLDYYGSGDFSNIPVLLNYVGRTRQFYYMAGLGLGFVSQQISPTVKEDSTEIAYQLAVGYDFTQGATPVFVEAKYVGTGETALNGWGIFVGVRF